MRTAEKDTSRILILQIHWRSGRLAEWSEVARFFAGGSWGAGSNPDVATSRAFFSFHRFLPFALFSVYSHS